MPKNKKTKSNQHPTAAGKRFLEEIDKQGYSTARDFYQKLSEGIGTKRETIEAKLSNFINNGAAFPDNYMLETERLLEVSMLYIIDGKGDSERGPQGLYEVGRHGDYDDYARLLNKTIDSISPLLLSDEFSMQIGNYVFEYNNIDGLRFLADHRYVTPKASGLIEHYYFTRLNGETDFEISKMALGTIEKGRNQNLFTRLLDNPSVLLFKASKTLLEDEDSLKHVLESGVLLKMVMHEPSMVSEFAINGNFRMLPEGEEEYQALCYSSWLTPLLNYALSHEGYKKQTLKLAGFCKDAARATYRSIIDNQERLSSSGRPSITTKEGLVILDHNYVIGVLGEPSEASSSRDSEISAAIDSLMAELAKIRALSLFPNGAISNGKMHLQRPDNPIYRTFLNNTIGIPCLLQLSDDTGGDQYQDVFIAPKGKAISRECSSKVWESIGKGLRIVHSIPTEEEGKVYCHGQFRLSQLFAINDELTKILGYEFVYLGDAIEDLSNMVELIFSTFTNIEYRKEFTLAFVAGYGESQMNMGKDIIAYFMGLSEKEQDNMKSRYYWNMAWEIKKVFSIMNQ